MSRTGSWLLRARAGVACVVLGALTCGGSAPVAFDGQRAMADLNAQVAIGPRPAGSEAAEQTRQLISERLRQAGWPVEAWRFEAGPPGSPPIPMVNLIARRPGTGRGRLIVGAHYDTKLLAGRRFVGANDGASGVAVLLELARTLGRSPGPLAIDLVFFDGEEAVLGGITPEDGLFGSRELAARMQRDGSLAEVRALLLVDMVGDRDLNLAFDGNSSPALVALASRLGGDVFDPGQRLSLVDDHMPFKERGLSEVLALIDFQFGERRTPGPLWHTDGDDLTAVSAESLNRVGALVVQLIAELERQSAPK